MTTRTRRREISAGIVARELSERGDRCSLCGTPLTPEQAHWHHVAVKRLVGEDGAAVILVDKVGSISDLRRGSAKALEAELAKCVPLCERPCHLEVCHGHPPLTRPGSRMPVPDASSRHPST